ncbi:MAG: hypothetical protein EBT68_07500 [Verrucomicrobia bacterium]|nr:hypothetical protein [Verrucomicrobiota bacterium]
MNDTVTVELPVARNSFETTGGKLGFAIGTLLNLKRMIELNMADNSCRSSELPIFSKEEMLTTLNNAIEKLDTIQYPYAV